MKTSAWKERTEASGMNMERPRAPALRYRDDASKRSHLAAGDIQDLLSELKGPRPPGLDFLIVANTADTYYFVLPPDPNADVSDEALAAVAAGTTAGSASTVGTASCLGCSCLASTFGTGGSAGSVSSAA